MSRKPPPARPRTLDGTIAPDFWDAVDTAAELSDERMARADVAYIADRLFVKTQAAIELKARAHERSGVPDALEQRRRTRCQRLGIDPGPVRPGVEPIGPEFSRCGR